MESRIQTFNRVATRAPRRAPVPPPQDNRYAILGSLDLDDVGRFGFPVIAESKVASTSQSAGVGRWPKGVSQRNKIKTWKANPQCPGALICDRGHESDSSWDSDVRCGEVDPSSSSDDCGVAQRGRSIAVTPCTASRPEEAVNRLAAGPKTCSR